MADYTNQHHSSVNDPIAQFSQVEIMFNMIVYIPEMLLYQFNHQLNYDVDWCSRPLVVWLFCSNVAYMFLKIHRIASVYGFRHDMART